MSPHAYLAGQNLNELCEHWNYSILRHEIHFLYQNRVTPIQEPNTYSGINHCITIVNTQGLSAWTPRGAELVAHYQAGICS